MLNSVKMFVKIYCLNQISPSNVRSVSISPWIKSSAFDFSKNPAPISLTFLFQGKLSKHFRETQMPLKTLKYTFGL